MLLDPHIERVQQDLRTAAALGTPELVQAVDHLAAALEASIRLAVIDAVTSAADELSAELAPGSVAVQMQDGSPRLVAHLELATSEPVAPAEPVATEPQDGDDELARVSLRISSALKRRADAAATRDGISTNTWITRAVGAALDGDATPSRSTSRGTMRGWAY